MINEYYVRLVLASRNVDLINEDVNVYLSRNKANSARLLSLNILQINAKSLINYGGVIKFVNALTVGDYAVACVPETWLSDIADSELLLAEYDVYRSDRPTSEVSAHDGSLIAVKKLILSNRINADLHESCALCQIMMNNKLILVCSFYNPTKGSQYRYDMTLKVH